MHNRNMPNAPFHHGNYGQSQQYFPPQQFHGPPPYGPPGNYAYPPQHHQDGRNGFHNQGQSTAHKIMHDFGVHITGFPEDTTNEQLRTKFEEAGPIASVQITTKKKTGRKVAFVNFTNTADQLTAVKKFHETTISGLQISVTKLSKTGKSNLYDVYVTGFDPNRENNELIEELEEISQVDCVRLTNKGQYLFYQVDGEENYNKAIASLNGARTSFGNVLASYSSKRKQENASRDKKLAEIMYEEQKRFRISPQLDVKQWYSLEKSLRTVHISNVSSTAQDVEVRDAFEPNGPVENINIIRKQGFSTGYAFVTFVAHEHHHAFKQITGKAMFIGNQSVRVNHSKPSKPILEIANRAGILDMDGQPTAIWFKLLEPCLSIFKQKYPELTANVMDGIISKQQAQSTGMYLQDPKTGQIYEVSPERYQQQLEMMKQQQQYVMQDPRTGQQYYLTKEQYQQQLALQAQQQRQGMPPMGQFPQPAMSQFPPQGMPPMGQFPPQGMPNQRQFPPGLPHQRQFPPGIPPQFPPQMRQFPPPQLPPGMPPHGPGMPPQQFGRPQSNMGFHPNNKFESQNHGSRNPQRLPEQPHLPHLPQGPPSFHGFQKANAPRAPPQKRKLENDENPRREEDEKRRKELQEKFRKQISEIKKSVSERKANALP